MTEHCCNFDSHEICGYVNMKKYLMPEYTHTHTQAYTHSVSQSGQVSVLQKRNVLIFLDTVNVINVNLCMMAVLIKL